MDPTQVEKAPPATPEKKLPINPGVFPGELLIWKGYSWQVGDVGVNDKTGDFIVLLVQKNETARHAKLRRKNEPQTKKSK